MEIYTRKNIKIVIERLNSEEIGILPTDTIYGISSIISAYNARARINKIKKANLQKDLIVIVASIKQASKLAKLSKKEILLLKKHYPTTVICNLNENYLDKTIVSDNKIAIRLIKNKFIKKIIKKTGPLYSTSANLSNKEYVGDLKVFQKLNVDFIVFDDFNSSSSSTIFDSINNKYIR